MAYELTIACGVVLAALLTGCYATRGAGSLVARVVRRALLFIAPLFLVALLFSLHHYWLAATADIVRTSTTIGQIENAIASVQVPAPLHTALQNQNAMALVARLDRPRGAAIRQARHPTPWHRQKSSNRPWRRVRGCHDHRVRRPFGSRRGKGH